MDSPVTTSNKAANPFGLEEGEVPTVEDVAKLIADGKAKRIVIMVRQCTPHHGHLSPFNLQKSLNGWLGNAGWGWDQHGSWNVSIVGVPQGWADGLGLG